MTPVVAATLVAQSTTDAGRVAACGPRGQQGWLCSTVYEVSHNQRAAEIADTLSKPVRILVILLVAWLIVRVARRLVRRGFRRVGQADERISSLRRRAGLSWLDTGPIPNVRRAQRAETIGALLASIVAVVVWAMALISVLDALGVALGPIVAGAGIVGVAIGFGAQSLVRDFLSGIFMLAEDQYGVGDVIDAGVATGTVEGISLRTTRLRDVEGVVWHVPNGTITRVGNKSQQWSRALLDLKLPADADIARASQVIQETADTVWRDPTFGPLVIDEPEVWGVEDVSPENVVIRLVAKTRPLEQWRVARELRARVTNALRAAGIVASPTTSTTAGPQDEQPS
ncbi:MAG TPA: mechanosensitive ion channel family protein [Acidimicrobiia bacterium]|nr:mechanosensitive ion channel family protein [Acidimicrobiia bacterium]